MRYVTTFLIEQTDLRIWWQEVAQGGASDILFPIVTSPTKTSIPNGLLV